MPPKVRVKSTLQGEYSPKPQAPIPFFLVFQDHFSHIKSLQENKKFVEHLTLENGAGEREFIYCVSVPKEEEFYPIVRYKCSSALRPVPIVSPLYITVSLFPFLAGNLPLSHVASACSKSCSSSGQLMSRSSTN